MSVQFHDPRGEPMTPAEPYRLEDGAIVVPDGPGFGIEIDEDKVARYRTTLLD